MKYVLTFLTALFLTLAPLPALAQDVDPVPVCTEGSVTDLETAMTEADLAFIKLTGEDLEVFAKAISNTAAGQKPDNIKTIIFPDFADESYQGDKSFIRMALFDVNGCFLHNVTFPVGILKLGLGMEA